MASKTVVVVLQEDGNTPESVREFKTVHDATKFIEDLIAEGIDHQRISVQGARPLSLVITHRPVVSLVLKGSTVGSDSQSGEATANRRPRSRAPGQKPLASPLREAFVTVGRRELPTISLN